MKINKYKIIVFFILSTGGIKLNNNSVSLGVFDLLFLIAFPLVLSKIREIAKFKSKVKTSLIAISIIQFIPLGINIAAQGSLEPIRFLYALRLLEYILLIPIFYACATRLKFSAIFYTALLFAVSIPIFKITFNYNWGVFQYSWELGTSYAILFAFSLITRKYSKNIHQNNILALISFLIVIYSNQRSPMISVIACLVANTFANKGVASKFIFTFVLCISAAIVFNTDNRLSNSVNQFSYVKVAEVITTGISEAKKSSSYNEFVYQDRTVLTNNGSQDLSFNLRIRKWAFALVNMSFYSFIIGLGPGFFGGAADSSILRIFFETGIIGIFLWTKLLINLLSANKETRLLVIVMVINGIFIDTFYSARVVTLFSLLIIWTGFSIRRPTRPSTNHASQPKLRYAGS